MVFRSFPSYDHPALIMVETTSDPFQFLIQSFQQARINRDANAQYCVLATVDKKGHPVTRMVTVRTMNPDGVVIYINGQSPKVDQLTKNPVYELLFFWPSMIRQFRLRGSHEIYTSKRQRHSWDSKPYAGKLYDLFQSCEQNQSSVLTSREDYLDRAKKLKQRYPVDDDFDMPSEQVSLCFRPDYIESWVASMEDRLHDRRLSRLTGKGWQNQVLVP